MSVIDREAGLATDSRAAPYSRQKMRIAVLAAVVLVSAGLLAGCGTRSAHSASPLYCLKAAGLSNAKARGSNTWQAIPPGVHGTNAWKQTVEVDEFPTAAKAREIINGPSPLGYFLPVGRYL